MAVPAGPTEKRYVGNGVSTIFTVPFLVIQASDLAVYVDGVKLLSGYSQSGVGNATSTVVFSPAPALNAQILLTLEVPFERLNDYQENGDFLSNTVNRDFDRIWQALKQLLRYWARTLTLGQFDVDGAGWYRAKGNGIRDLRDPVQTQDATTKSYVDAADNNINSRIDSLTAGLPGTNYAFPWSITTTQSTKTLSPGFEFASATLYLNGIAQTFGRSFAVAGNQILLAEAIPAGSEVYAILGQKVVPTPSTDVTLDLYDYAALRAYTGASSLVRITAPGIEGHFNRTDGSQEDNGLVFFRDGLDRTWERQYSGDIDLSWSGAKGDAGTTDNYSAILLAISAVPPDSGLVVRRGPWGGTFANKTSSITLPPGMRITMEKGARLTSSGGGSYIYSSDMYAMGAGHSPSEYRYDTLTRGILVELRSPITGFGASSTYQFNRIYIDSDQVDAQNDRVAGSKVDGFYVGHRFGGSECRGGRHAFESTLIQASPTASDNNDQNYVGGVFAITGTGDGGTPVDLRGSYFAANFYASLKNAKNTKHLNGCESNVLMDSESDTLYRTGYSAACAGVGQGTSWDAAFSVGALGLPPANTSQWRDGLLAGRQNGRQPISRGVIRNECTAPNIITTDRDTVNLLNSDTGLWKLSSAGYEAYFPNHSIQTGSKTVVNTPVQLFYTGSTFYAGRLVATGGAVSSNGAGTLAIQFAQTTSRQIIPDADSTHSLGTEALQWSALRAVVGRFSGPVRVGQYTLATLPSAAAFLGYEIDVTDAAGGSKRCRSNGSNWLILNTTTNVS